MFIEIPTHHHGGDIMKYGDHITLGDIDYTVIEVKNAIALLKDAAGKLVYKWIGKFNGGA